MNNICLFKAFSTINALNRRPSRIINNKLAGFAVAVLLLLAEAGYAQEMDKPILMSDVSIEKVINEIEKTSDYVFLYNRNLIPAGHTVSLDEKTGTIQEILDKIFEGTDITYSIAEKQIILSDKTQTSNSKQTPVKLKGVVKDAKGEVLIGVSIKVKNSGIGTITGIDGDFTLQAQKGSVLEVSYIGYDSQEITVGDEGDLSIVMQETSTVLDEVVVTALGIKRAEKALSYNVQKIGQDEFVTVKDPNLINSINGKVAGVTINKSSTGVGGAARVIMRGAKSIEGDNNVLYVIDGIPLFNSTMGNTNSGIMGEGRAGSEGIADFNPEDVESMSILSGPSAAALYGSSAANGAILITTKKGEEGKLQIALSSSAEFSKPLMLPEFQNTYGAKGDAYESWGDKLLQPSEYDPGKDFFNTGMNFINSVTLNTGNKQNQTFASIAFTNANGIVPNNTYDRFNLTIRNSSSFLNDKVRLDLGASYIKQKDMNMISQGTYWNPVMVAYLFPRGRDFEAMKTFETYDETGKLFKQNWPMEDGTYANQNPYWIAYRNLASSTKNRFMFNVGLSYKIMDGLDVSSRYRIDRSFVDFERKLFASTADVFAKKKGKYEYSDYKDSQEYADIMINVNKYIGDFSIGANVGFSYSNYWSLERGYKGDLLGPVNLFAIQNIDPSGSSIIERGGDSHVRNFAVFANMEWGWKSMVYLTLTGRNDWNSRLVNTDEESFFYPSVGLSGIITEMVKLPDFISYWKVRGSFTEVGSPISISGRSPGTTTTPIVGGALKDPLIYPFEDFKAERTHSYELGTNFRLLRNKISANITWYKSNTYNQTFLGNLPGSSGYKAVYLQAGDVENKGWEISLGYNDKFGNLRYATSLSYTKNINTIKEMVEDFKHPIAVEPINISEVVKDGGRVVLKVGGSINDIYASQFLKKDNQGYVDIKENGSFGLGSYNLVYLGKTTPDFTLGWSNSFAYKGFTLGILLNGRFGGVVTSSTQAIMDRFGVSKESAEARDNGGVMIPYQGKVDAEKYYKVIGTGEPGTAGYYMYSATNIRLQQLTLSYTFPTKLFNHIINDLTVTFMANNPWMIYCKAPHDPELTPSTSTYGQGNDYFMQPSVKSFGFGVKVKF